MAAPYRHTAFALAACLAGAPCLSQGAPAAPAAPAVPVAPVAPAAPAAQAALVAPAVRDPHALPPSGAVGPAQGRKLIKDLGKGLVILDVRTPSEYGQGHIPGSLNVPVADVDGRMAEFPPDRPTLIVCKAGTRAARAYKTLAQARPGMAGKGLWYLDAVAEYGEDGTYRFMPAAARAKQ